MDSVREPLRGRKLYFNMGSVPFWAIHIGAVVGVLALGFSWSGLALAVATYYVRMFFLTAGYHRYFAHRTFSTSRWFQLVLAVMGQTCAQMGALWWAANHRAHHRYSDQEADVHSPVQRGFWWSHIGWFLDGEHEETDYARIPDLVKYPELVFLNNRSFGLVPPALLAISFWAVGGLFGLVWFFVSTMLLWHGTFTINSFAHLFGKRRYATRDDSRNNWLLALLTLGEGWHNNHHHYQASTRQGFFWWEIDPTYYGLRLLALLGIVWDIREPPQVVLFPKKAATPSDTPAAVFPHASSQPDRAA